MRTQHSQVTTAKAIELIHIFNKLYLTIPTGLIELKGALII